MILGVSLFVTSDHESHETADAVREQGAVGKKQSFADDAFYCSEPSAERNVTFVQEETNYLCNVIIQLAYDNTWLQRRCMTTSEAHHQHLLLVTIMIIKHFRGFRATRTSSSASERASETAHICPRGLVVTYDILTDTMACWVESPESFDFYFFFCLCCMYQE